jgi:hypothetical protein
MIDVVNGSLPLIERIEVWHDGSPVTDRIVLESVGETADLRLMGLTAQGEAVDVTGMDNAAFTVASGTSAAIEGGQATAVSEGESMILAVFDLGGGFALYDAAPIAVVVSEDGGTGGDKDEGSEGGDGGEGSLGIGIGTGNGLGILRRGGSGFGIGSDAGSGIGNGAGVGGGADTGGADSGGTDSGADGTDSGASVNESGDGDGTSAPGSDNVAAGPGGNAAEGGLPWGILLAAAIAVAVAAGLWFVLAKRRRKI